MAVQKHTYLHHVATVAYHLISGLIRALIWQTMTLVGYFLLTTLQSPYNFLFGLPVFLGSLGLLINALLSVVTAVTSKRFIEGTCIFCSRKLWFYN